MKKTELNKSVGETLQVICLTCKNRNNHKVLASVDNSGKEFMGYEDEFYYWDSKFQIIECQGCGSISFRSEHSNSEDFDEEGPNINELIYPKRTSDTWNIKDFFNIPYNLRRIYRETIDCYNNENLTLCGAGVRALVEGLCKENNVIDGEIEITKTDGSIVKKRVDNLQGKINGLYEKGKLTKENAEILHEHRFLGNTAIHDLSAPTKEELNLAITIIEHVFDTLYEIPEKATQLKDKRLRKQK
jgi:hypothetical protein